MCWHIDQLCVWSVRMLLCLSRARGILKGIWRDSLLTSHGDQTQSSAKSTEADGVTTTMRSLSNLSVTLTTPVCQRASAWSSQFWMEFSLWLYNEDKPRKQKQLSSMRWHFAELEMFGMSLLPAYGRLEHGADGCFALPTHNCQGHNRECKCLIQQLLVFCICVCACEPVYRGTRAPDEGHSCLMAEGCCQRRLHCPYFHLPRHPTVMPLRNIFLL